MIKELSNIRPNMVIKRFNVTFSDEHYQINSLNHRRRTEISEKKALYLIEKNIFKNQINK